MYERFINEFKSYSKAIRVLSKGYSPISLIPPSKLETILQQVKAALAKANKNYDLVLNRLYLYYDMKLVMFGIDNDKNFIIQFPTFVESYTKARLTMYQIETVAVPILDTNSKAQSYTHADGTLPFLDVLVIPQPDGSLSTTVYRKPTHTGQYLQWDSHHAISAKYSVISTLFHRAKEVCSTKQHLVKEQDHIKQALTVCKYPKWALNRAQKKTMAHKQSSNKNKGLRGNNNHPKRRTYITVPYIKGLGESVKNTCKKYGIQVFFKGGKTIKDLLMAPKRQRSHHSEKWHHLQI